MSFGIYREGKSLSHRLDPRTKLLFVLAYIVAAFMVQSATGFALVAALAVASLVLSGSTARDAARSLKPFLWLILFVLVFDVLFVDSGTVLFQAGIVCVSTGGIAFALKSALRFCCVLLGSSTLMTTTSPTELSDGVSLLLEPLERLGLKTHNAAVTLGMTLRFVPVIVEEFGRIREAQELRGADFSGNLASKVKASLPMIVPLFQSSLRRAETLALAMENREYDPQGSRTSIRNYELGRADRAVLAASAVLVLVAIADLVVMV